MSVRDDLVGAVEEAVPASWRVIPYQDSLDITDTVTVMFKQLSIQPLPAAPRSAYRVNYVLTLVPAAMDPANAEADLDAAVVQLLAALNPLDWFAWEQANKVLFQSTYMAYDITCWNIAH